MAILKDLLDQTSFEQVWDVLRAADSDADKYKETYAQLYDLLKTADPAANTDRMTIRLELAADPWVILGDEDEGESDAEEEYLQIVGVVPGDDEGYGIGLKEPAQLAGMDVDEDTLAQYGAPTVLAYCITEITYSHTTTENLWSAKMDTYAGGLYAAESCAEKDMGGLSIEALRRELGLTEEEEQKKEDYKEKYGFLF